MQKLGQRWLLPAKCVVWRVQRSPRPSCIKFSKTLTTGVSVGVGVAGGGAGRGGCHDQDVIVTAPPHMETGGGQTHYPAHDTGHSNYTIRG